MHRLLTLFFLGITALRALAGEGFVTAGRPRIHYLGQGRGPALVFLHAGYQDANMWREQQAHFAGKYRTWVFPRAEVVPWILPRRIPCASGN